MGRRTGKNNRKVSDHHELHHHLDLVESLIFYTSVVIEFTNFCGKSFKQPGGGQIPDQWIRANGIWIPKEEAVKEIKQFWVILQLRSESKIFFGILARRFSHFSVSNGYIYIYIYIYIYTSVQKRGYAEMPGCLVYTRVMTQLLGVARENKSDLVVL